MLKKINRLKPKYYRLFYILSVLLSVAIGIGIILYSLNQNIIFFYPPSKLYEVEFGANIRIGGIVKKNSLNKIQSNEYNFVVTDNLAEIKVNYIGILPIMFRENQGVVVEGKFQNFDAFQTKKILIKHDENYKPNYKDN